MDTNSTQLAANQSTQLSQTPWPKVAEDHPRRWLVYPMLGGVIGVLALLLWAYHVNANMGTDQNGYMVTARLITEKGELSFKPESPFQFAGRMMVVAPSGRIYAKYPFGYPLLAAMGRMLHGFDGMYLINPVCMVFACFFSYFLFRMVLGNFTALMGVVWMAFNPVGLAFANDANSHATTLLCVVIGAWGILQWLEKGGWWRGVIGGMAMGYACTIRYTEFLLVLPVLFVALAKINFDIRRIYRSLPVLIGWAIPITTLAMICWMAFGAPWRTGYSFCKEQTGFGWQYFLGTTEGVAGTPPRQGNWETLLYQLNHTGLFLLWPMSLVGMVALFWYSWKLAATIVLWVVPPTVLYMFYYWAPTGETAVGYLRFFLTVFPGMILAGLWVLERALGSHRAARALALGALTALGASINLMNITPQLESSMARNQALRTMVEMVKSTYPSGLIFGEEEMCNQLDVIGGYTLYDLSLFGPRAFTRFNQLAADEKKDDPTGLQRTRAVGYRDLLGVKQANGTWIPKTVAEIDRAQLEIVDRALGQKQRVAFVFQNGPQWNMLAKRPDLKLKKLTEWQDPPPAFTEMQTRWQRGQRVRPPAVGRFGAASRRWLTSGMWSLWEVVKVTNPEK